ncbi:hypothetical protein [Knoellia sp. Soil729]|uniref:hypothetical protein n=1 Tax=Knoellia sp. Soil729 TaxID=1736394 RepID=UPI0007011AFD|nr:hypothetical protein [Knoellia sp. Soil729]KRE41115.1 hypothetical protein ASG74_14745 [Knoellia sp. Soil729]
MTWQRAFPYATDNLAVVGVAKLLNSDVLERSDGTWDAYSESVACVRFALRIESQIDRLADCLPPGADVECTLELVVSLEGVHSRQRRNLYTLDVGSHDLEIELDPAEYLGRVDLAISARLKTDLPAQPGFAHLRASRVSQVSLPSIWFSEPPTSVGDALEVRWENFDEDGDLVDGQLFAVRLEERPVILLNSEIPKAYDILGSKGTWGSAARIRDAIYGQIVHQAWSSIIAHCILEITRHDEADAPETVLAELDEWQAQVIRAWASEFVPGEPDPEAAAVTLIEHCRETGSLVLLHQLPEVIQRRCSTIDGFNGLIKESHRFDGGGS